MPIIITPEIKKKLIRTPELLRTHSSVIRALDEAAETNRKKLSEFNKQSSQHLYHSQMNQLVQSMNDLNAAMKLLPSEETLGRQIKDTEEQKARKAEVHLQRLYACETVEHVKTHIWPVLQPKNGEIIDLDLLPQTVDLLAESNRIFISLIRGEDNIDTKRVEELYDQVAQNFEAIKNQYDSLEAEKAVKPPKEKAILLAAMTVAAIGLACMASMVLMTAWPMMIAVLMIGVVITAIAAAIYLKHQSEKNNRFDFVPSLKRNNKMYQLHKSTLFRADEVRFLLALPTMNSAQISPQVSPSASPELNKDGIWRTGKSRSLS